MRILRVWLMVLLCSVLAMPLQAGTATHTTQEAWQQAVSTTATIPVSLFMPEELIAEPEALPELNKASVAACYALLLQLYFPDACFKPLPSGSAPVHNITGLHTILTAGP